MKQWFINAPKRRKYLRFLRNFSIFYRCRDWIPPFQTRRLRKAVLIIRRPNIRFPRLSMLRFDQKLPKLPAVPFISRLSVCLSVTRRRCKRTWRYSNDDIWNNSKYPIRRIGISPISVWPPLTSSAEVRGGNFYCNRINDPIKSSGERKRTGWLGSQYPPLGQVFERRLRHRRDDAVN